MGILIDANVILDIVTEDPVWFGWSSDTLSSYAANHPFVINPIIYSEIYMGFKHIEDVNDILPPDRFRRDDLPWEAAFIAGKCFLEYRRKGGAKHSPLPDFFIGAHAQVMGFALMTKDDARFRTYFPELRIISPPNAQ